MFILLACLFSQLPVVAHAGETSATYLFESSPHLNGSGPVDAAVQLGYYVANSVLVKKCDTRRGRWRSNWENRIDVGIIQYGSRYGLSENVRKAVESDAQKQVMILFPHGKIPVKICRAAETMFKTALAANMEPPNGTRASDAAEATNAALIERLKDGFSGSVRNGKRILSFRVDHFMAIDHNNFNATLSWDKSGATTLIKGRVAGNEQLSWKETSALKPGKSSKCEYTLNRRSPTSMAGIWGNCSRAGFVEIAVRE